MSDNDRFSYSYDAKRKKAVDRILSKYSNPSAGDDAGSDVFQRMKALDRRVERPATVVFSVLVVVGILTFGGGLSIVLVDEDYLLGSVVGIVGLSLFVSSFGIREKVRAARRRLFSKMMSDLAGECEDVYTSTHERCED